MIDYPTLMASKNRAITPNFVLHVTMCPDLDFFLIVIQLKKRKDDTV